MIAVCDSEWLNSENVSSKFDKSHIFMKTF